MSTPADLWLAPHDARVRSLREGGVIGYGRLESPFGPCSALSYEGRIIALRFGSHEELLAELQAEWAEAVLEDSPETEALLRRAFEDPAEVPILATGTPFQLTIWEYLRRSGNASTMTYGEVARAIGRPGAARAVGQAVGANPLAVVIPCHRVVSRGKLTGYRWGIDRKKALLAWELSRKDPLEMPF